MQVFKLCTLVKDNISGTKGMLTHIMIDIDKNISYFYQRNGLNPETKKPIDLLCIGKSRIEGAETEELDIPFELIGEEAEDLASGYKGKIIGLIYHMNGCLHVELKSPGIIKKTGSTIGSYECDIRRIKGPKIKEFTEKEIKASIKKTPSPIFADRSKLNK